MKINLDINHKSVIVEVLHEGKTFEIIGSINPFGEFEPSAFSDAECESFYDANWEEIEETIINQ
jgi:hypothetical protein